MPRRVRCVYECSVVASAQCAVLFGSLRSDGASQPVSLAILNRGKEQLVAHADRKAGLSTFATPNKRSWEEVGRGPATQTHPQPTLWHPWSSFPLKKPPSFSVHQVSVLLCCSGTCQPQNYESIANMLHMHERDARTKVLADENGRRLQEEAWMKCANMGTNDALRQPGLINRTTTQTYADGVVPVPLALCHGARRMSRLPCCATRHQYPPGSSQA